MPVISDVTIKPGNSKTYDKIIRRRLLFRSGGHFSNNNDACSIIFYYRGSELKISRQRFLLNGGLCAIGGSGLLLTACGGGGGGVTAFPSAGTRTFEKSVLVTDSETSILDPVTGCRLLVPAGSMSTGSSIQLTVWSGQRNIAGKAGFDISERAYDITLNPNQLIEHSSIEIRLPWRNGADSLTTSIVAYGANGRSLVLRDSQGATSDAPSALIGFHELQYLSNSVVGTASPIVIQFAVAEPTISRNHLSGYSNPLLEELWSRPLSRTTYAKRQRVAIVTHGILDDAAGQAPVTNFLKGKFPTDGEAGTSFPFDKVAAFGYDWKQRIQANGAAFAAEINAQYGDPQKYEVYIFAHSMGGLVSRVAVELEGTPSVKQLVTLGTPHLGVPLTIMKNIVWLNLGVSLAAPGVKQLLEDSDVVKALRVSRASNVEYKAMAGTSHSNFKGGLGDAVDVMYTVLNLKSIEHDGIVPKTSALGGPAKDTNFVAKNHTLLVDQISSYWSSLAGPWVSGLNRKIKSIELTPADARVMVGQSITLQWRLLDKDQDELDQSLIQPLALDWKVSNQSVASIANGIVTGNSGGSITVTLTDQLSGVSGTASIKVRKFTSLKISPETIVLNVGQSKGLDVVLLDQDNDEINPLLLPSVAIQWSSSDANIATVSDGVVVAKKVGTVVITAKDSSTGLSDNATLSVSSSTYPNLTAYIANMCNVNGQFSIGRSEVTVAMWREFCFATGRAMPLEPEWGWIDDHPIVNVSWHDCNEYCSWSGLRMPTEAQWQLAATGGDGRNFPWGGYGGVDGLSGWDATKSVCYEGGARSTAPVGSKPSGNSPFGCSDMAGNVFEWCADDWDEANHKNLRGGGWFGMNYYHSCSHRTGGKSTDIFEYVGVRLISGS